MFSIKFLEMVVRETRTRKTDWYVVYDCFLGESISLCSPKLDPHMRNFGSVREFIRDGAPHAHLMSDRELAEVLADYLVLLEADFAAESENRLSRGDDE